MSARAEQLDFCIESAQELRSAALRSAAIAAASARFHRTANTEKYSGTGLEGRGYGEQSYDRVGLYSKKSRRKTCLPIGGRLEEREREFVVVAAAGHRTDSECRAAFERRPLARTPEPEPRDTGREIQ